MISFFIVGCSGGNELTYNPETVVKVKRSISISGDDGIEIGCNSAVLIYNERKIIINEPLSLGAWGSTGWVTEVEIKDNSLILKIPADAPYNIWIGKQKHRLEKVGN